jgi:uncharacterized protein YkwD
MKKTTHYLGALAVVAALVFVACQKDDDSGDDGTTTTTSSTTLSAKDQAKADYNSMYKASAVTGFTWNGKVADCNPGTLTQTTLDKALLRIKYFRKLAGLPNDKITMETSLSTKCQYNALMIKANNQLSHFPPSTWSCYSDEGKDAAGNGNIAIGASDIDNIDLWMEDEGSNNAEIGHRRWILYSRATKFGFGCTNSSGTLWVINGFTGGNPLPAKTPKYMAWPPKGYVPNDVVYPRWSLSVPAPSHPFMVDFTNATVEMTNPNGDPVALTIEHADEGGGSSYGDNTIIWRPQGINLTSTADQKYTVMVKNVLVSGVATNYTYDVIIFKP